MFYILVFCNYFFCYVSIDGIFFHERNIVTTILITRYLLHIVLRYAVLALQDNWIYINNAYTSKSII